MIRIQIKAKLFIRILNLLRLPPLYYDASVLFSGISIVFMHIDRTLFIIHL